MSEYKASLEDIRFMIDKVLVSDRIRTLPGYEDFDTETQDAILEEAGRFAARELVPLNKLGDRQGARWHEGGVASADGFAKAYARYAEAGWGGICSATKYGGMGMPAILGAACAEIWNAANMSFTLCPMLTSGAVKLLTDVGSDAQKTTYLEKMISGEWTGTMDLTEPQAGSDLAAVRTRANPEGGHYRLFGQKIFITWGEHDMAENIVHMVLARLPDASTGVRGISLFVVPKYLINEDGSLGARNDMRCAAIEHKLGIHASPTCTMVYGDNGDGAVGYLVGEPGYGLNHMFIMMNQARHQVGIQGLAVADAAYQQALAYAQERVQGHPAMADSPENASIIYHPDVRRMLLGMCSQIDAMRGLAYDSAVLMDIADKAENAEERRAAQARLDLLIPITKGWITEVGIEITSIGIQIHGGMGFVEETGAAQFLRDARIAAIYEGTNGIQANDLAGRKLLLDGGAAMRALIEDIRSTGNKLKAHTNLSKQGATLIAAVDRLDQTTQYILQLGSSDPAATQANAFNYMMQVGYVLGGWYVGRSAIAANSLADTVSVGRIARARFYSAQILPKAEAFASAVLAGPETVLADINSVL